MLTNWLIDWLIDWLIPTTLMVQVQHSLSRSSVCLSAELFSEMVVDMVVSSTSKYDEPEVENVVCPTMSCFADWSKRCHVTFIIIEWPLSFRPISAAAHSWSYDNDIWRNVAEVIGATSSEGFLVLAVVCKSTCRSSALAYLPAAGRVIRAPVAIPGQWSILHIPPIVSTSGLW